MMDKTSISKVSIEMSLFAVLDMLKLFADHSSEADFKKEIFHANIFFEMIDLQSFWSIFSTSIYDSCADAAASQFSRTCALAVFCLTYLSVTDESVLKGVLPPLLFATTTALKSNANFLNGDVGKFISLLVERADFSSFNEHAADMTLADLPYLEAIRSVELFPSNPSNHFVGIACSLLDIAIALFGERKLEPLFEADIINSTLSLLKSISSKAEQSLPSQICERIGALGALLLSAAIDTNFDCEPKLLLTSFLLEFDALCLFLSDRDIVCLASAFWPVSHRKGFSIANASEALLLLCRKRANLLEDFVCKTLIACPSPLRILILRSLYDRQECDFAVLSARPLMLCVSFISDPVYAHLYEHVTELFGSPEIYRFIDTLVLSTFEVLSKQDCASDFGQLAYIFETLSTLVLDENESVVQALKGPAKYPLLPQLLAKLELHEVAVFERIDIGFILATRYLCLVMRSFLSSHLGIDKRADSRKAVLSVAAFSASAIFALSKPELIRSRLLSLFSTGMHLNCMPPRLYLAFLFSLLKGSVFSQEDRPFIFTLFLKTLPFMGLTSVFNSSFLICFLNDCFTSDDAFAYLNGSLKELDSLLASGASAAASKHYANRIVLVFLAILKKSSAGHFLPMPTARMPYNVYFEALDRSIMELLLPPEDNWTFSDGLGDSLKAYFSLCFRSPFLLQNSSAALLFSAEPIPSIFAIAHLFRSSSYSVADFFRNLSCLIDGNFDRFASQLLAFLFKSRKDSSSDVLRNVISLLTSLCACQQISKPLAISQSQFKDLFGSCAKHRLVLNSLFRFILCLLLRECYPAEESSKKDAVDYLYRLADNIVSYYSRSIETLALTSATSKSDQPSNEGDDILEDVCLFAHI